MWASTRPSCSSSAATGQPLVCLLQDFQEGAGERPQDGQEVTFSYVAYNESGAKIDSSYQKGRPASTRLGINGLIPGEEHCACQGHFEGVTGATGNAALQLCASSQVVCRSLLGAA